MMNATFAPRANPKVSEREREQQLSIQFTLRIDVKFTNTKKRAAPTSPFVVLSTAGEDVVHSTLIGL